MGPKIISFENSHMFGSALPEMLRLRYKEFKARQSYNIPTFKNMEYDAYDTPAAVYIVWEGHDGKVYGCSRMAPTDRSYMLKDLWPHMVTKISLPNGENVWESSRFCIDSTLPPQIRKKIKLEILQAKIEYALAVGIDGMVGVMPPLIWRSVFVNSGWPVDHIGPIEALDTGEKIVAGWMHIKRDTLTALIQKTGITDSLIDLGRSLEPLKRVA